VLLAAVTAASAVGDPHALVLGSIPSPSSNRLGPLHMYGLMIAIGVIAAVEMGRWRWRARGGNPDDVYAIAFWAVPAGLIGARLYHVMTDWNRLYSDGRWWPEAFKVWNGGLGIPGGAAVGIAVGVWVARRRGWNLGVGLDALIPGIPLAQAIGRLGNWWNQELFGGPTSLPWGVEIDVKNRPLDYVTSTTFHPTFLYELLWNLALCYLLVRIDRTRRLRPGTLLPLYVGGYFLGRLWVEAMRVDTATKVLGIRVNIWMSIIAMAGAVLAVLIRGLWRRPEDSEEPYRDGHRWTDPDGDAPSDGEEDHEGDEARAGVEPSDEVDEVDEVDASSGDDDPVVVSDDPAEGPPPT
jgi:prolipoprotein diacylglyceryl transferase